jgi:hypothetical protein
MKLYGERKLDNEIRGSNRYQINTEIIENLEQHQAAAKVGDCCALFCLFLRDWGDADFRVAARTTFRLIV